MGASDRRVLVWPASGLTGAYGWMPPSHTLRAGTWLSRAGQAAGVTAQRVIGTSAVPPSVRLGQRLSLAMNAGTATESAAAKPGGSYDVDVAVIGGGPAGLSMVSSLPVMFWSRCQEHFW